MSKADEKRFLSGAALARLCSVSEAAITKARKEGRLHREENLKKYDIQNRTNAAYIENSLLSSDDDEKISTDTPPDKVPDNLKDLYARKLAGEVARVEAAAEKIQLANAVYKKDLIPAETMGLFMGVYATANRDFFFPIGRRIARGDLELQGRIDKEIFAACLKTRTMACNAVEKEYKKVAAAMREVENAEN